MRDFEKVERVETSEEVKKNERAEITVEDKEKIMFWLRELSGIQNAASICGMLLGDLEEHAKVIKILKIIELALVGLYILYNVFVR